MKPGFWFDGLGFIFASCLKMGMGQFSEFLAFTSQSTWCLNPEKQKKIVSEQRLSKASTPYLVFCCV
jgi:hypothetical protein